MVFLQNIWWYLVLIGVMIMIHELGHYWAARLFDVKVETFSFGFGPRLFGFRRGERPQGPDADVDAVKAGRVSVTPIKYDRTDEDAYADLTGKLPRFTD